MRPEPSGVRRHGEEVDRAVDGERAHQIGEEDHAPPQQTDEDEVAAGRGRVGGRDLTAEARDDVSQRLAVEDDPGPHRAQGTV